MYRLTALLLTLVLFATTIWSQENQQPPNYQIPLRNYRVAGDEIIVEFAVYNQGGPATQAATLRLENISTRETIVTEADLIPPLQTGQTAPDLTLSFPVTTFDPGTSVIVGFVLQDASGNTTAFGVSDFAGLLIEIPDYANDTPTMTPVPDEGNIIMLPLLETEVDLDDPQQVAMLAGIVVSGLLMIAMLILLVRVLLQRSPTFGNWQPPYATMPPLDPNSTYGRRQSWQPHAQNNFIPQPCQPGTIHARKVLLGMDGSYLSGWRITAVRMTQYDMYGRVSRSQVLASGRTVKRLDRITRKSGTLDNATISKRIRPAASAIARRFRKKINQRSAMLPIALDVRLQGTHGEVRIVFELYECQNSYPVRLDQWEPEMTVLGKTIHESYTYTIFGQNSGESYKAFRRRLKDDVEQVLVGLVRTGSSTSDRPAPASDTLQNIVKPAQDDLYTGDTQESRPYREGQNDDDKGI